MQSTDVSWTSCDGVSLSARWWPAGAPRGVVCLLHGLGDHGGALRHVAGALNQHGWSVLAPDLRGHGRSAGQRGYTAHFNLLVDDVQQAAEQARAIGGEPLYLYGQSMGANLAARCAERQTVNLAGLILSSPVLKLAHLPPAWKLLMGRLARRLWPSLTLRTRIHMSQLTRDPELSQLNRDDLLRHDRISAALYFGLIESGQRILDQADQLTLPTLIMHGDADSVTSHTATQQLVQRVGPRCTLKVWPNRLHELHNDTGWREVVEYVAQWLDRRQLATSISDAGHVPHA